MATDTRSEPTPDEPARRATIGARQVARAQEELDGYREYAARVRYLLLPGVW